MNPIKIEKGAIEALKRTIRLHDNMDEFLQENDKEPSWDGDIILYNNVDLKKEHIQYRIPTQVKGKNDSKLLKRDRITYPVEYGCLRTYRNNSGVCYFVIIISDDGERAAIFYNALTPIKLKSLLKNTEMKKSDQTKNIPLERLKRNDKNELYKILLQFGHDSKEEGAGELVRKSIKIEDMKKIDSIRMTAFVSEPREAIQKIQKGEICLFGYRGETDTWFPFTLEDQLKIKITAGQKISKTFSIDDKVFYDEIRVEITEDCDKIRMSENLAINVTKGKFEFSPKSVFEGIKKDIDFLNEVSQGTAFYVDRIQLCTYGDVKLSKEFQNNIDTIHLAIKAFEKFEIECNTRIEDFNDENWISINELINLYLGNWKIKEDTAWHMWWWGGKVYPIFVYCDKEGKVKATNFVADKRFDIKVKKEHYRVPRTIQFTRDIWEKLYDVDEEILLEDIEKSDFNEGTEDYMALLFVEVLSAYDTTKCEKYYDMAKLISDKLLETSPGNKYWMVNRWQIIKRKRNLLEVELQEIEEMECKTEDKKLICAINILLENKRRAKKELEAMEKEEKEIFISYPIYNLL